MWILAWDYFDVYGSSPWGEYNWAYSQSIVNFVFLAELIFKIIALGPIEILYN